MAKTLAANTVAEAFAEYDALIIMDGVGGKNTETELATTYSVFVPAEARENLPKYRQWANNNWEKLMRENGNDVSNVLAKLSAYPGDFSPSEPKVQSPLDLAIQRILCRLNPSLVEGKAGAALVKFMEPVIAKFKATADLERYQAQIEAEIATIRDETAKRLRRGDGAEEAKTEAFSF